MTTTWAVSDKTQRVMLGVETVIQSIKVITGMANAPAIVALREAQCRLLALDLQAQQPGLTPPTE